MRLATFNLLHGQPVVGADISLSRPPADGFAPPDFTDDGPLRESALLLDADIVGLQEVDAHQPRSGGHHQVDVVADALHAGYWKFVPALLGTPGTERTWVGAGDEHHDDHGAVVAAGPRYGVGLVSRLPVIEWRSTVFDPAPFSLPLLVPASPRPRVLRIPDEPRVAIAAVIQGERFPFTVATAHLSFVPGYNVRQLRQLKRWLSGLPRPVFLLGDFNLPGSLPRRLTGWTPLATMPTYPSTKPRVQFDHVLADGLSGAQLTSVRANALALPVSDHCAVTVDLNL